MDDLFSLTIFTSCPNEMFGMDPTESKYVWEIWMDPDEKNGEFNPDFLGKSQSFVELGVGCTLLCQLVQWIMENQYCVRETPITINASEFSFDFNARTIGELLDRLN